MRVDILTKEYPPAIYGGAGVHVTELVKALRARGDVTARVHAFGSPIEEAGTDGLSEPDYLSQANAALRTMGVDLGLAQACEGADLVHSHTWYANFAGHVSNLLHGHPHILTGHSLEPLRPWKAEQLGGGYRLSSWIERTAYESAAAVIAVSHGMRADMLRSYPFLDPAKVAVVHNGIDSSLWTRTPNLDIVRRHGVNPDRPSVIFVGRITRQKGLPYLLKAAKELPHECQLILCAGAPDTPEIMAEVESLMQELQATREGVIWIPDMLPRNEVVALLSAATVFVCPSVYEPLGIVYLEAMACELPVVATATCGIPEVVVDGETGWLVPIDQVDDGTGTPRDESVFVSALAGALCDAVSDPARARERGVAGRARAVTSFSWEGIGERTLEVYRAVLDGRAVPTPAAG